MGFFGRKKSATGKDLGDAKPKPSPQETEEAKTRLRIAYDELADECVLRVLEIAGVGDPNDEARKGLIPNDWEIWEEKENGTDKLTIEKSKTSRSGTICGRGTMSWIGAEGIGMDELEDYIWDDKTKSEYDESTEAVMVLWDAHPKEPEEQIDNNTDVIKSDSNEARVQKDWHVIDQVFKGRFGISGRDFMLIVHCQRRDVEGEERLVIGGMSIPMDDEELVASFCEKEDVAEKYNKLTAKVVRGVCFVGGYYATYNKATRKFSVVYVNDADVKSTGVPQWIVSRVKLDQLHIVQKLPVTFKAHCDRLGLGTRSQLGSNGVAKQASAESVETVPESVADNAH